MEVLSGFLGIVGILGVAGAIAACVAFPAIAIPILQAVTSAILKCKPCLIALAIGGAAIGGWWYGHHKATLQCREAEVAAELRNREIDLEAASKARSDETKRANDIEAEAARRAKDDAEFIEQLKNIPACLMDGTDANGMHQPVWSGRAKTPARPK